jgi:uncharacterized membrane protein YdbT with pleckstrin-like domain
METRTFRPNPRYRAKLFLVMTVIAVAVMAAGLLLSWLVGKDEGPQAARDVIFISLLLDLAWYLPAVLLIGPYFRSLMYEIQDDEVIVHVGIWTKSVKHVPFRTVTNLKVNRDIFDRWFFDLGSLNVQTAGMSGQNRFWACRTSRRYTNWCVPGSDVTEGRWRRRRPGKRASPWLTPSRQY